MDIISQTLEKTPKNGNLDFENENENENENFDQNSLKSPVEDPSAKKKVPL